MRKTMMMAVCVAISMTTVVTAQSLHPETVQNEDKSLLRSQSEFFKKELTGVVEKVSESVVSIQVLYRGKWTLLSYGTVTPHGIITKWSEVSPFLAQAKVIDASGKYMELKPIGVYEEYDLVLLSDDLGMKPLNISQYKVPELGDFISLVGVNGQPSGFGVVSVLERTLRNKDRAFLGLDMNFNEVNNGILITGVVENSAAHIAGVRVGDRLMKIGEDNLTSAQDMLASLNKYKPGDKANIDIWREGKKIEAGVTFGAKSSNRAHNGNRGRVAKMESLGGLASTVRGNFPRVIQTDIKVAKNGMGAPVVDLEGNLIGLALSRSRMKTQLIPADDLFELLKKAPTVLRTPKQYDSNAVKQSAFKQRALPNWNFIEPQADSQGLAQLENSLLKKFFELSKPQANNLPQMGNNDAQLLMNLMEQMMQQDAFGNDLPGLQQKRNNGLSTNPREMFEKIEKMMNQFQELERKLGK